MADKCVINFKENGDISSVDIKNPNSITKEELNNVKFELSNRQIAEKQAGEKAKRAIEYVNSETAKAGTSKAIWESIAENWAKENNFWIEDYEDNHEYATQGGEHLIYTENGNTETIRKVNHDIDDISDWYKNLLDFNQLFPNTGYEIVGFTRLKKNYYAEGSYNQGIGAKGNFSVVVKQNFIPNKQIITQEEIQSYLEYMGFERMGTSNDYQSGDIILGDMNTDNVIKDRNGNYHIIDAYVDIPNFNFSIGNSENNYQVPKDILKNVINTFKKSGLFKNVSLVDSKYLERITNNNPNGLYNKNNSSIYLNVDNDNIIETAFHEFSHPYLQWLKEFKNPLFKAGIKVIENNKEETQSYIDYVLETQPYLKEDTDEFYEEVLAQLIGDNGAKLIIKKKKNNIERWLESFWLEIRNILGLSERTPDEVANMTVKEFYYSSLSDMLNIRLNITSTPTLKVLESELFTKMRGKQISVQNIKNNIKNNSVKEIERNIIESVLKLPEFSSNKIDYDSFEESVKSQVMRLDKISTNDYSDYGAYTNYDSYDTIIFNTDVTHNIMGHFDNLYLTEEELYVGEENHDRKIIGNDLNKGLFGHTRIWTKGDVYNVSELQSDVFQKGDINIEKGTESDINQFKASEKVFELRLIRESIKDAYQKNFSKLRLPLPYTISIIEGYIDGYIDGDVYLSEDSKVGEVIEYLDNDYFIFEKNEDDKYINIIRDRYVRNENLDEAKDLITKSDFDLIMNAYVNSKIIDIHTANVYIANNTPKKSEIVNLFSKEYEDDIDLQADIIEILNNNVTNDELIDFYKTQLDYKNVMILDNQIYFTNENYETISYDKKDNSKSNFKISDLLKSHQPIAKRYEEFGKILKKERGENFRIVTDQSGYDWYETDITELDGESDVIAFQLPKENLKSSLFESLKQLPLLTEDEALEIYKQSFSEKLENWDDLDLNC